MKIAVLSDIHGNLPALEAVLADMDSWGPEQVIVAGDTVNRGPRTPECLAIVRTRAAAGRWHLVRGNHEDYVINHSTQDGPPGGPFFKVGRLSYWTYTLIREHVPYLAALPDQVTLSAPDGSELRAVHASMRSNQDGVYPDSPESEVAEQIIPAPTLFVTGHIHFPFVRRVASTLIVNAGSVGTPADGDLRASYARVVWDAGRWHAEIARIPYNRERAGKDYYAVDYFRQVGAMGRLVYEEWRQARYLFRAWIPAYYERVMAGEIELDEAVDEYLAGEGIVTAPLA